MLFILNSHIWALSYFLFLLYTVFIISTILYIIPIFTNIHKYNTFKTKSYFTFIHWINVNNIFLFFIFLFYCILVNIGIIYSIVEIIKTVYSKNKK
jgi:hypothetical protein